MRVMHYFLGFLLLFLVVIISLWYIPMPAGGTGQLHPEFKTMLIGGDSISTSTAATTVSYLFGLGVLGVMCFFLYIGARRNEEIGPIRNWLLGGMAVYFLIYTLTFRSYLHYAASGHDLYFGGWPLPTAWMIYGLWSAPGIFLILYIFKFKEWVLSDEDEATFQKIVEARRARLGEE